MNNTAIGIFVLSLVISVPISLLLTYASKKIMNLSYDWTCVLAFCFGFLTNYVLLRFILDVR